MTHDRVPVCVATTLQHGEWLPWLKRNADVLGFKAPRTAQLLIKAASNAKPASHLDETTAVAFSRKLWGNDNVRGTQGTGENEWYTPAEIIDGVRAVMGIIDLDPASSEHAQRTVQARQFFMLATLKRGKEKPPAGEIFASGKRGPRAVDKIGKFAGVSGRTLEKIIAVMEAVSAERFTTRCAEAERRRPCDKTDRALFTAARLHKRTSARRSAMR